MAKDLATAAASYQQREGTAVGRIINDVIDTAQKIGAALVAMKDAVLGTRPSIATSTAAITAGSNPMSENPNITPSFQGSRFEGQNPTTDARALTGRSAEGFHAGVQTFTKSGQIQAPVWSGPLGSEKVAAQVAIAETGRIVGMPARRVESGPHAPSQASRDAARSSVRPAQASLSPGQIIQAATLSKPATL